MKIPNQKMDHWVLRQLRGRVLSDLSEFVPDGYFDTEKEKFPVHADIEGARMLSNEMRWGYLAGKLGQKLQFHTTMLMTARQVSASEVLMHLGALAAVEAQQKVTEKLSKKAQMLNVPDGNSTAVAEQMKKEHIPQFQLNLLAGLQQYLLYLSPEEAKPFMSIVQNTPLAPIHLF